MTVQEFISNYRNHPVLFIGAGISLRYLENSYTWDGLLKKISFDLKGNDEFYFDIKSQCENEGVYEFDKVATLLEEEFNQILLSDRDGKFKEINDIFYEGMANSNNISRLKIYISKILENYSINHELDEEISEFKKIRKNIGSIITTNYDCFIEDVFEFEALIGNDILLSNPYGSVYKIHGCITQPSKIILTEKDYEKFDEKYELIRAQLLSIFIHNPIIFLGYKIGDENIKSLLKTIFTYVNPASPEAEKIRENFLLVEREVGSCSQEITEHDIDIEGFQTIRINKLKTNDFSAIYKSLSNLALPVSAMDIRKVQGIVKEIYAGGSINVNITEDLDSLDNSDKIIAIGSFKTVQYQYQTISEMMVNYFRIIEESNAQLLRLINKQKIQSAQYFPIFAFSKICPDLANIEVLKIQQKEKVESYVSKLTANVKTEHRAISEIMADDSITSPQKVNAIIVSTYAGNLPLDETQEYLIRYEDKKSSSYRRLLCTYDLKMYDNDK